MPNQRDQNARPVWSAERLRKLVASRYGGESIVVLSNRAPFNHDRAPDGSIVVKRSGGGLVTALEPLIHACSGVWVASGAGTADRAVVDERDGLTVSPATAPYRLRRVWLNAAEERGYYYGFSNEGLWPLCHRACVDPIFRTDDFQTYREVNARFAAAVAEEAENGSPLILVQDYHFALAPLLIRRRLPLSTVIAFWHIPWPSPRRFATCPWGRQLLEGLLGSSIVGFQTPDDCANFLETVSASLDAYVDQRHGVITCAGRETRVRAYPASVEWPSRVAAQSPSVGACRTATRSQLGLAPDVRLGVGVDRLDYTKGITEKLCAVERLLESHPEHVERFVFVQIAEPSRHCLPAYRALRSRLWETADRINGRFGTDRYRPIVLLESHHDAEDVYRFLRAADLCFVGSLHDGMNLVAKEFVTARDDDRGVLILSRFAGAARELTAALVVNPWIIDESAGALAEALSMPGEQQSRRMRAMRSIVAQFNSYRWAAEMLAGGARLRTTRVPLHDGVPPRWRLADARRAGTAHWQDRRQSVANA
jgi:trehalose 6-phosphate synthase